MFDIMFISIMNFTNAGAMPVEAAFYFMNLVPMIIIAIYLSMMLVSFEKDNNTIETIFAIPGSPYKVWLYKLAILYLLMIFIQFTLVMIIFIFVADFPIMVMLINGFIPIFMISNLNFYFSTVFKSGYVAGLISLIVLFFNFVLADELYETVWFLYLNPFGRPVELDIDLWNNILFYNKLGITLIGLFFLYLGLRKLLKREPFID